MPFPDCLYRVPRGPQIFYGGGQMHKKSLRSVLLPTDTRRVLKFCKDPFRGVNGIDSKEKQHLQNRRHRHIGGGQ